MLKLADPKKKKKKRERSYLDFHPSSWHPNILRQNWYLELFRNSSTLTKTYRFRLKKKFHICENSFRVVYQKVKFDSFRPEHIFQRCERFQLSFYVFYERKCFCLRTVHLTQTLKESGEIVDFAVDISKSCCISLVSLHNTETIFHKYAFTGPLFLPKARL